MPPAPAPRLRRASDHVILRRSRRIRFLPSRKHPRHPEAKPKDPLLAFTLGLFLALSTVTVASAQSAAWLDAQPQSWNRPGAPPPSVVQTSATNITRCTAQQRTATGAEESALTAIGWRLETYWPATRARDLAVVLATSGYDGMCR